MARFAAKSSLLLALLIVFAPAAADAAPKKKPAAKAPAKVRSMPPAPPQPGPEPPGIPKEMNLLAEGELPLAARGAIVIDAFTGEMLYGKSPDEMRYPASTTKIMTALLVIEEGDLDREVEVALEDSKVGERGLYIKPGERYTRRQMLYGLMLRSANDVAHALARDNAGSVAAFAEKMTLRAHELGAKETRFMNPHGLHHREHYSTPRDLALIARAAMQQPHFRRIVGTVTHPWAPESAVPNLRNGNRLLTQFAGCTGVKTGYTNPAQQVLVSAARRDEREVIAVVMHTNRPGIWEDSKLLLTYGFEHPPKLVVGR